ncbi:putative ankyrin repeat-containing domain-containing protein [Plasmopara halstedii]
MEDILTQNQLDTSRNTRAALWKKQVKQLKLKDVGKKIEAMQFCIRNDRFFREQLEVLPLLMGFLSRTKTPALVMETLVALFTLISPSSATQSINPESEVIHAELNAKYILERSTSHDAAWKAGEPFVVLFSMKALASEIRIKAIEVLDRLLNLHGILFTELEENTSTLSKFMPIESTCSSLLSCLGSEDGDLQFAALSCLASAIKCFLSDETMCRFDFENVISRSLGLLSHSERRFHRPALNIVEAFSKFESGRHILIKNVAIDALGNAIREAHEILHKISTIVPTKGIGASPLSANDALVLGSCIVILCQVFVRTTLARYQMAKIESDKDDHIILMDVIEAMIGILQFDIATALTSRVNHTESTRMTNGTTAAASTKAANTALLADLFPFSIERCVNILSSLGRLIKYNAQCKAYAKAKGLLPILLDFLKVDEVHQHHQIADRLLHTIYIIDDFESAKGIHDEGVEAGQTHKAEYSSKLDPCIICAVSIPLDSDEAESGESKNGAAPSLTLQMPPLVAVDTLLALLETSYESANKGLTFRILRWIGALVDLPENANALGERAVSILLKILATTPFTHSLLFAFLAKSIHAIVLQNPKAFELCGRPGSELISLLFQFLHKTGENPEDSNDLEDSLCIENRADISKTKSIETSPDQDENVYELKEVDNYEDGIALTPIPGSELFYNIDSIDVLLAVSEAIAALARAYQKWNISPIIDTFEVPVSKLAAPVKSGALLTAGESKKKISADHEKSSVVGDAIMLGLLEGSMQVLKLISQFMGVNPAVCVSLLELLDILMTTPKGMKVMLELARSEVQALGLNDQSDGCLSTLTAETWPLSVNSSRQMEHTILLLPLLNVLQSPDTSFLEIEAAVRLITVMTSDHVEATVEPPKEVIKNLKKGGDAAPVVNSFSSLPQIVITESDRFINAGVGCGMIVVLLAFMDTVRLPKATEDSNNRVCILTTQIDNLLQKFITLGQEKDAMIMTKYKESMSSEGQLSSETPDLKLPYKTQWAQLLNHQFDIPRFGYMSYSALLLATELEQSKLVKMLLSVGASSETVSSGGLTPLMIAFLIGNTSMVIDLLEARANVDAITTDGHDITVWNCALVSSMQGQVNDLITSTYTCVGEPKDALIMNALIQLDTINGSFQCLDVCLEAEVDVNVSNAEGNFLLHALLSQSTVRCKLRGLDVCFRYESHLNDRARLEKAASDLIRKHSADVNCCNQIGQTPLHLALLYGHTNIAKVLLKFEANPNVQCMHGHLPLHYACLGFCGTLNESDEEAIEMIKLLLLQASHYPKIVGVHKDWRKHKSAEEKQTLVVEQILKTGFLSLVMPEPIVCKLSNPQEILATTSFHGNFLPWHFSCGACYQFPSKFCLSDSLIKLFKTNGHVRAEILKYFIREWHIDISMITKDNLHALHLAIKTDVNGTNLPVIKVLLEYRNPNHSVEKSKNLNINAVHDHILIDSLPIIPSKSLVLFLDTNENRRQAYVSTRSNDGKYHIILENGQHLDNVAREKLQVADECFDDSHRWKYFIFMGNRFSALHYALQLKHDTLALLLLAQPDISLDPEGNDLPLLALACAAGQSTEVVRQLITQQANMRVHLPLRTSKCDLDSFDSMTEPMHAAALHYAVMYDNYDMAETLLSSPHVLPNVQRSGDGFTPLHLACEKENIKMIKLLLDHGAKFTQLSSGAAKGVSPLQLLIKVDNVDSDLLKELVRDHYLPPEVLLEGCTTNVVVVNDDYSQNLAVNTNEEGFQINDYDVPSCALLQEEQRNFDIFERFQAVVQASSDESLTQSVRMELEKSDNVLCLFFEVLRNYFQVSEPNNESDNTPQLLPSSLYHVFQQIPHRHECYRHYKTRSQWKCKSKTPRKSKAASGETVAELVALHVNTIEDA